MPDLNFLFGGVTGALLVYFLTRRRHQPPRVAPAPAPSTPAYAPEEHSPLPAPVDAHLDPPDLAEPAATTPSERLLHLAQALLDVGDNSAHPRDLLDQPLFNEAVLIMAGRVPLTTVIDYASGANWVMAAAAFAALAMRDDGADAVGALRGVFVHLRPWPVFYALKYLERLDPGLSLAAILAQIPEWWVEHPFLPAWLADYMAARDRDDAPSLGETLPRLDERQVVIIEGLLRKIDAPRAQAMQEDIARFRRARIDRDYLRTFGRFVDDDPSRVLLVEHPAIAEQLAAAEAGVLRARPRSLLVVGEPRSGKTTFLLLLAERLRRQGWTLFEAGGPEIQAGQEYIGQLEERIRRLTRELASEKRVLWHVADFVQLAASGTHRAQSASLLDQLLPAIASGQLVVLSEITPSALTRLLQVMPSVRTSLELIRLRPLDDGEIATLVQQAALAMGKGYGVEIEPEVTEAASHLARHYLGSAQMPGALLDLMKLAAQRAAARDGWRARLTRAGILETMSQLTGMPEQVLDDRERIDLAELRRYFTARVIGQDEAVDAVVNRVAMLKAGLTDPGRPVGVFLFAGPTGTGKTELARSLAEYLFGSPERLIRLDMSEFQSVESVRKIIGDGTTLEGAALTDRVRKQPFSVVLLDEFEKAHPNAWDLFLQVFDAGRLTDGQGHTVDFRHCIIILTSNVGSTIRQDSGPGFLAVEHTLSADHVRKAIHQNFRPEFVNRLDRIIVFRALTREDLRRIVGKELARVLDRRGLRHREWAVEWEASALDFLLDKGFSPAMGARPLKRAIDEHLLAPLAATLVEHRYPEGDQFLFVRSDGRALQVEFVDPDAPDAAAPPSPPATGDEPVSVRRMMVQAAGTAAEARALGQRVDELQAEVAGDRWTKMASELAERMQRPDFWDQPDRREVLSRLEVMDRVKAALGTAVGLVERLTRTSRQSGRYSRELISRLATQAHVVALGIEDVFHDAAVDVLIAVQPVLDRGTNAAVSGEWCDRMIGMYQAWGRHRGMRMKEIVAGSPARGLLVSGLGAARVLAQEAGLHVMEYRDADEPRRAVARIVIAATPQDGDTPAALLAAIEPAPVESAIVRRYELEPSPLIRDIRRGWRTGRSDLVLGGHFDVMEELAPA